MESYRPSLNKKSKLSELKNKTKQRTVVSIITKIRNKLISVYMFFGIFGVDQCNQIRLEKDPHNDIYYLTIY